MGLIKKFYKWRREHFGYSDEDEYEYGDFKEGDENDWDKPILQRDQINIHDMDQRIRYIKNCLEQIGEASKELETVTSEYSTVTSYLSDMEEIEALPREEKTELVECALKVTNLEDEKKEYQGKKNRMSDAQFHMVERFQEDMEESCKKLNDCENYQSLIKQDLHRLEGEKHAYYYRKSEMMEAMENARGMAIICSCAVAACMFLLFIFQYALQMDTQIGYLLTAGAGALALTYIYLRYSDSKRELSRVNNTINRLIQLQNTVKIRYINNTHLLEYLYMKYGVTSASELEYLWEQFSEEADEREHYKQSTQDCDFYQKDLIRALRRYHIKDPNIWLHQSLALIDSREMVEIRHNLIQRRQKLRKQMEYNKGIADMGKAELKDLADAYPQYASSILAMVNEYEKTYR